MRRLVGVAAALGFAASAMASSLSISLGVRETAAGGGADVGIGGNGGTAGGIEWIDLDGQTLNLDGTWQQFTFDLANANTNGAVTAFAGTTANGILEGAFGVVEHIRIRNTGGATAPLTLWIDDITNTIDPPGPPPPSGVNFGDFEGHPNGTEVMFQEPGFSGSTAGNILLGGTAGTTDADAHGGLASYGVDFQFIDADPTRWVRLTTFSTAQPLANPMIRFDQGATLSLWVKGVPEPGTLALLGLGGLLLRRRR